MRYKIVVVKMGAYVGYLYEGKRRLFFFWKWTLIKNCIDNEMPYSPKIEQWQKEYNVPDKDVKFDIARN